VQLPLTTDTITVALPSVVRKAKEPLLAAGSLFLDDGESIDLTRRTQIDFEAHTHDNDWGIDLTSKIPMNEYGNAGMIDVKTVRVFGAQCQPKCSQVGSSTSSSLI
jgi:hypothetical protein